MNLIKMKCENCGATLDVNKDLDKIHCNYCGTEILIDDEATKLKRVEDAKLKARQDNHEQDMKERQDKLEQDIKEKEILSKANEKENFKKSKFSKILLIFFAISVLFFFAGSGFYVKVLTLIQATLFIASWLIGMKIIKEPFKGAKIILAIIAFILIVPIVQTGGDSSSEELEKINWNDIEMKELLPKPSLKKGHIYSNEMDRLSLYFGNAKKDDYKKYVKKCKNMNYELEVIEESDSYEAFNNKGYKIKVSYSNYNKQLDIDLDAPEEMKEIEWPTNGLGSKVPQPKSNYGRISWDNESSFIIHVGNTSIDDYNEYVKECENAGFVESHSKTEKNYSAYNSEGIKVHIMYLGGNVMEISVSKEDKKNETSTSENTEKTKTESQSKPQSNSDGLRSDFKKAMDDYEKFMNDYVEFMKKYSKSDGTDLSLLKDYNSMMTNYQKYMDSFDKWDDEDLNIAESKYYLEVQTRINKKLLEIQ